MSVSVEPSKIQDAGERQRIEASYRPLPYGWLLPCAVFLVLILWGTMMMIGTDPVIGGTSAITLIMLFIIWRIARYEEYWGLNVRGYAKCYYLNNGMRTAIWERGTNIGRLNAPPGTVAITVPLGGWLHGTRVVSISRDVFVEDLSDHHHITVSRPDILGNVWLRWSGRRIYVSLSDALEILQYSFGPGGLDFAGDLVKRLRRATREREAAQQRFDRAHAILQETITRLDATTRFIQSKQAQAIRQWLASQLAELGSTAAATSAATAEPAAISS